MNLELINLFEQRSQDFQVLRHNRLLFEFNRFLILLEFDAINDDEDFIAEANLNIVNIEKFVNQKLTLVAIRLSEYEYLEYRDDISSYDEHAKSITNNLYSTLQRIYEIDKCSIEYYNLDYNYGYDDVDEVYCEVSPNFIYNIYFKKEYFENLDFFSKLIDQGSNVINYIPPSFYDQFYIKDTRIDDDGKIQILNTSTKTRRLGYFRLLAVFFKNIRKVRANYISKKFERFVSDYEKSLLEYENSKGIIKITKTGISAQPYINLSKELGLINSFNNVYSIGKSFKVYEVLMDSLTQDKNAFSLSNFDKLFFLEKILEKDFLYVYCILEHIFISKITSYSKIVKIFQELILNRLNEFYEQDYKSSSKIKEVINRINKWKSSEVYLEHIIMPRLNWLLDLSLIEMDKKLSINLTDNGIRLFKNLCVWNDLNCERVISTVEFLKRFAIHMFANAYEINIEVINVSLDEINYKIDNYIIESFKYFKTLAPNRVTASQAINYTKYKMFFDQDIMLGYKYIENYLSSDKQGKFIYKFQARYKDGYIQIKENIK